MTDKSLVRDTNYWMISLIHDSRLRHRFDDPLKLLKAAGLNEGQNVLEVGCGPGFFTVPAAQLVGEKGCVYAIDLVPAAIKRVEEKVRLHNLTNVKASIADAATSLRTSTPA